MEFETFTFKLAFNGEIHLLTVSKETTFEALLSSLSPALSSSSSSSSSSLSSPISSPILTWIDDENDTITLSSTHDLQECLAALARKGQRTLKLTLTTTSSSAAAAGRIPSFPGYEQLRREGSMSPPSYEAPSSGRVMAQVLYEEEAGKGRRCWVNLVCPGKGEKLRWKLAKKEAKAQRKLDKLFRKYGSSSRSFDNQLFESRLKHLEGLGVPILPLVKLFVAKEIVWQKKREACCFSSWFRCCKKDSGSKGGAVGLFEEEGEVREIKGQGRSVEGWESMEGGKQWNRGRGKKGCCSERSKKEQKKIWLLKDGTRRRLEEFEELGLPSGLWMGVYLEVHAPSSL